MSVAQTIDWLNELADINHVDSKLKNCIQLGPRAEAEEDQRRRQKAQKNNKKNKN